MGGTLIGDYSSQNQIPTDWKSLDNFALQQLNQRSIKPMADGSKPVVICGGAVLEAKDLDDAQRIAEEQAHKSQANAYILKPVRKVAPKRDVVTTEL